MTVDFLGHENNEVKPRAKVAEDDAKSASIHSTETNLSEWRTTRWERWAFYLYYIVSAVLLMIILCF